MPCMYTYMYMYIYMYVPYAHVYIYANQTKRSTIICTILSLNVYSSYTYMPCVHL